MNLFESRFGMVGKPVEKEREIPPYPFLFAATAQARHCMSRCGIRAGNELWRHVKEAHPDWPHRSRSTYVRAVRLVNAELSAGMQKPKIQEAKQ